MAVGRFRDVDGVDGLAKIREGSFDLVFTDLEMPRMHGFELIRELRFLPAYRDLPIAVVTSRSGNKHRQQARVHGGCPLSRFRHEVRRFSSMYAWERSVVSTVASPWARCRRSAREVSHTATRHPR